MGSIATGRHETGATGSDATTIAGDVIVAGTAVGGAVGATAAGTPGSAIGVARGTGAIAAMTAGATIGVVGATTGVSGATAVGSSAGSNRFATIVTVDASERIFARCG